MSYFGRVRNGVIVFENGDVLPEGTVVRIEAVALNQQASGPPGTTLGQRLLRHAGAAGEGLPSDLARNHDHYLHGQPKR